MRYVVLIYKNKGDIIEYENYKGINLIGHSMTIREKIKVKGQGARQCLLEIRLDLCLGCH